MVRAVHPDLLRELQPRCRKKNALDAYRVSRFTRFGFKCMDKVCDSSPLPSTGAFKDSLDLSEAAVDILPALKDEDS